ncbi:orotidine-5'-phosphate decarboxylase [Desulfonatronum thiosulfatophilum]|uniref:Orotidine 5'-phosphate decarboxylase n=1 Tax=Desulfonatronum thiosulfatophilum TaxID=617002 RepID=A0A1G6BYJ8_9BACT|nr:orotidine-5'-phosphate decarboxylase [Desulfonatronum thiosulfatophilum]SDB25658.1 orotidine-5'-phosphate decarboxylase [Desulfonatronum thiosulfatophilum]
MAELIVALDTPDLDSALELVDQLRPRVQWFKIGLELFSAHGPRAVEVLRERECKIFLDLKYLDIPNTVRSATRIASGLGVNMLTVHLSGGQRMIQAALDGCLEGSTSSQLVPMVLGVTMLTSLDQPDVAWMDNNRTPSELAEILAEQGRTWGIQGVVCSVLEASRIKKLWPSCLCITPGIRNHNTSTSSPPDDQSRIATPATAVAAGADFLVVGRPITKAVNPAQSAADMLVSIAKG